jgi:hypothetical protein
MYGDGDRGGGQGSTGGQRGAEHHWGGRPLHGRSNKNINNTALRTHSTNPKRKRKLETTRGAPKKKKNETGVYLADGQ